MRTAIAGFILPLIFFITGCTQTTTSTPVESADSKPAQEVTHDAVDTSVDDVASTKKVDKAETAQAVPVANVDRPPGPKDLSMYFYSSRNPKLDILIEDHVEQESSPLKFQKGENIELWLNVKNIAEFDIIVEAKGLDGMLMPIAGVKTPAGPDVIEEIKKGFEKLSTDDRWWTVLTPLGMKIWKKNNIVEKTLAPGETWRVKTELSKLVNLDRPG